MDKARLLRYRDAVRRIFLLVLVCCIFGCDKQVAIEDRFLECRELVAEKESREESFKCWSKNSRPLVEALLAQKGQLRYLKLYPKLLNYDEISDVQFHGDLALATVVKGKRTATLVFLREDGEWTIDALEVPGFWTKLDAAVKVD